MSGKITVLVQGASTIGEVPGLDSIAGQSDIRYAPDRESLYAELPDADVLLGWDFRADDLEECWNRAEKLRWIHWGGAGVDAVLFPALRESDVVLTNSRGIFDRAMAEWTLGVLIGHAKRMPETMNDRRERQWTYRVSTKMAGQKVLIVGIGSIGREVGRLCRAFGLRVSGVGRSARQGDHVFDAVHARRDLVTVLPGADYVVLIAPLTPGTENIFDGAMFAAMKPSAFFVNIGRGALVDEKALIDALDTGGIAGAALDVFREEPLSPDNPVWTAKHTFISPHISGDYHGFQTDLARLFLDNFHLYRDGLDLRNVVDKTIGFVPSGAS